MNLITQHLLSIFLLLVLPAAAQFQFFDNMFGQQQHQHREPQNAGSDSAWYQQQYEAGKHAHLFPRSRSSSPSAQDDGAKDQVGKKKRSTCTYLLEHIRTHIYPTKLVAPPHPRTCEREREKTSQIWPKANPLPLCLWAAPTLQRTATNTSVLTRCHACTLRTTAPARSRPLKTRLSWAMGAWCASAKGDGRPARRRPRLSLRGKACCELLLKGHKNPEEHVTAGLPSPWLSVSSLEWGGRGMRSGEGEVFELRIRHQRHDISL